MNNKCIFTICSKNYLAQALTLKESIKKHEPSVDFYIFLADLPCDDIKNIDLILLDESWIPDWRELAFKYNVIEFNTSIKPFCFKKLYKQGYDKVIYLDPDMFVVDRLDYIWNNLDDYSIILTPHISNLEINFTGAHEDTDILIDGIFNLGFAAIRNNQIGNNIVDWWCVRLKEQCYAHKALFYDQKWMIFIPCFYPNDLLICRHFGINVAIWNLHERELFIENKKYLIKDLATDTNYPLLIFHFSGFDPFNDKVINRRIPRFGVDSYPSFIPIIQEYKKMEYKNGYEKYSRLKYDMNEYSNGYEILPLHRRLFRATIDEFKDTDPFSENGKFYKNLERSGLLVKQINKEAMYVLPKNKLQTKRKIDKYIHKIMTLLKCCIGIKRYCHLLHHVTVLCEEENQTFMMRKLDKMDKDQLFTDKYYKIES